jgi:hypothetical protein
MHPERGVARQVRNCDKTRQTPRLWHLDFVMSFVTGDIQQAKLFPKNYLRSMATMSKTSVFVIATPWGTPKRI